MVGDVLEGITIIDSISSSGDRGSGEQKEGVATGWSWTETKILAFRKLILGIGITMSEQPCHL